MAELQLAVDLCPPSQTPLAPVTGAFPLACQALLILPIIAAHCLIPVALGQNQGRSDPACLCYPVPFPDGSRPLFSLLRTTGSPCLSSL